MRMTKDQADELRREASNRERVDKPNVQSLPSRSEVHGKRREIEKKQEHTKKEKRKKTFLVTRLLLGAFILLIGITLTYKYWSQNMYVPVHSEDNKGVEQVEIER